MIELYNGMLQSLKTIGWYMYLSFCHRTISLHSVSEKQILKHNLSNATSEGEKVNTQISTSVHRMRSGRVSAS